MSQPGTIISANLAVLGVGAMNFVASLSGVDIVIKIGTFALLVATGATAIAMNRATKRREEATARREDSETRLNDERFRQLRERLGQDDISDEPELIVGDRYPRLFSAGIPVHDGRVEPDDLTRWIAKHRDQWERAGRPMPKVEAIGGSFAAADCESLIDAVLGYEPTSDSPSD